MYQKMLVCLDGSKSSEEILPFAAEQAKRFGSKIVLFRAFTLPGIFSAAEAPDLMRDEEERLSAEAAEYLDSVAKDLRENGLDVTTAVAEGGSSDAIIHYARDQKIDLIALATHKHSRFGRILHGNEAEQILRGMPIPLLVMEPVHN